MPETMYKTKRENTKISAQFRTFRRVNLISQESLAKMLGVSERTVRNIETGANGATVKMLIRFRDVRQQVNGLRKAGSLKRVPR